MDRSWMYGKRNTNEFLKGVDEFIRCAVQNQNANGEEKIACPCIDCKNLQKFHNPEDVRDHVIRRGFRLGYTNWIWHGESVMGSRSSKMDETPAEKVQFENSQVETDFGDKENDVEMDGVDEMDRMKEMVQDMKEHFMLNPHLFESLSNDMKTPLYPGCSGGFTRLSTTLKLCNLKVSHGWSDKSFTELLKLLKEMLPEGDELPATTYQAKRILCPMGMDVKKIDACPNDCYLFKHESEKKCPKCHAPRYKRQDTVMDEVDKKGHGPPAKVLWYLPIIPRFKRLFSNGKDAKRLRWHAEERKVDNFLRHPADSPQWRTIDRKYPDFSGEIRNLRLGLSTDGVNPFGSLSTQHSTWPVLLVIYNLPPYLCMKRKYMMLSMLISGPKQPGNNIDVYLEPLIEDLQLLWGKGVSVFDAYTQTNFTMRAMLFCTISDFPAYGNLSGYAVKSAKGCPYCDEATISLRLKHCKKSVYNANRPWLPLNHPYRKQKKPFNGHTENRVAPLPLTGEQIYERVKNINVELGKNYKAPENSVYKRRSILWDKLPYWKDLLVRHCVDVMHVEKNVCDSLVGTLLNIPGKTKDGIKARKDMVEMGIRPELAPQEKGNRTFLPPACFTLSREEKVSLLKCLADIKVPHGYSSNIKRFVSMKDLKLVGMKSHDCHMLMEQFLPIAIRGILPKHVRQAITGLCFFFNKLCSKVVDPDSLDELQLNIVVTLCQLEMYFPPSFFDVMVHMVLHLVRQVKLCGPVHFHSMWPFERFMSVLKRYVRNRFRPEGSIIEGYTAEEAISFCSDYLPSVETIGVPKSRHEGRLEGKGTVGLRYVSQGEHLGEMRRKAHLMVLQHLTEVHPYVEKHIRSLKQQNPSKGERWIHNEHNRSFAEWFENQVVAQMGETPNDVSETIQWLAYGPDAFIRSYEGYDINGYTFYTQRQDNKSTMQNSGVVVEAISTKFEDGRSIDVKKSYYGVIQDIWELRYKGMKVPLFLCNWVDSRHGVDMDDGFTLVDLNRWGHKDDPFILASQAKQVFYIVDPSNPKWSVVLQGKRRILGIEEVEDEDEYDQFDENPPFSTGFPMQSRADFLDNIYLRSDHDEGLWLEHQKS